MEEFLVGDVFVLHRPNYATVAKGQNRDYRIPSDQTVSIVSIGAGLIGAAIFILFYRSFIPLTRIDNLLALIVIIGLCLIVIWLIRREKRFEHAQILTGKIERSRFRVSKQGNLNLIVYYSFSTPDGITLSGRDRARRNDLVKATKDFEPNFNLFFLRTRKVMFLQKKFDAFIQTRQPKVRILYVDDGLHRAM